jgi:transcriptional regulator with XRE-family HTH domain
MLSGNAAMVKGRFQPMPKDRLNIVGPEVRRLRNAAGMSQMQLAATCQRIGWDVERDTISKIEGGRRWVGDFELVHLARALRAPMVDLFPVRVQGVVRGRK